MKTKWKNWLKAAGVRAVKTIAQTAVATIGTSAVLGEVDWIVVASASVLAPHKRCRPAGAARHGRRRFSGSVKDNPKRGDIN